MRYLILFIALLPLSCQQKVPEEFSSILYKYEDSSVAPEYHRSFKIILNNKNVVCRINSYSTTLVDTTISISSDVLQNLKKQLQSIDDFGDFETCKNCDGSSHTTFSLLKGKSLAFELEWNSAKTSEKFQAILDQIKYTVPNFKQLLNTPLPKK